MKINKNFITLLTEEKLTKVFELPGEDGLGVIIRGKKTLKSFEDVDEIFYTIDFLEKEKMITVSESIDIGTPNVGDCLQGGVPGNKRDIRHWMDTDKKLGEYYKKEIKTNFTIYDFVKNGYKTDLQKERNRNFWLPISIAIGATAGTPLLTVLFEKMFLCN